MRKNYEKILSLAFILFLVSVSFAQEEKEDSVSINIIKEEDTITESEFLNIQAEDSILNLLKEKECSSKNKNNKNNNNKNPSNNTGKYNPCKNRNEISGYMISIITSRQETDIDNAMFKIKSSFSTLRLEKRYNQPDWRLLVGDYFSKKTAEPDLMKVRRFFPSAVLINWRVYCNRAK